MNSELYQPFELCFKVFRTLGMWQDGDQTWTYFFVGYLSQFIYIYVFFIGEVLYAFLEAKDLVEFVSVLGLSTAYVSVIAKGANFFLKLKKIKKSLATLNELLEFSADDRWKTREKLKSRLAQCMKVYKTFWFVAYLNCGLAIFVPVFSHELSEKFWFPFDTKDSSFGFWFASTFLIGDSFLAAVTDVSLDILPVIFMSFAIGLVEELADRFEAIGKDNEGKQSKAMKDKQPKATKIIKPGTSLLEKPKPNHKREFIKCVKIQQKIKEFVSEIQANFSAAISIQGILSTVILCMNAFTMSMV
jgi:hypothetical protein